MNVLMVILRSPMDTMQGFTFITAHKLYRVISYSGGVHVNIVDDGFSKPSYVCTIFRSRLFWSCRNIEFVILLLYNNELSCKLHSTFEFNASDFVIRTKVACGCRPFFISSSRKCIQLWPPESSFWLFWSNGFLSF